MIAGLSKIVDLPGQKATVQLSAWAFLEVLLCARFRIPGPQLFDILQRKPVWHPIYFIPLIFISYLD